MLGNGPLGPMDPVVRLVDQVYKLERENVSSLILTIKANIVPVLVAIRSPAITVIVLGNGPLGPMDPVVRHVEAALRLERENVSSLTQTTRETLVQALLPHTSTAIKATVWVDGAPGAPGLDVPTAAVGLTALPGQREGPGSVTEGHVRAKHRSLGPVPHVRVSKRGSDKQPLCICDVGGIKAQKEIIQLAYHDSISKVPNGSLLYLKATKTFGMATGRGAVGDIALVGTMLQESRSRLRATRDIGMTTLLSMLSD